MILPKKSRWNSQRHCWKSSKITPEGILKKNLKHSKVIGAVISEEIKKLLKKKLLKINPKDFQQNCRRPKEFTKDISIEIKKKMPKG